MSGCGSVHIMCGLTERQVISDIGGRPGVIGKLVLRPGGLERLIRKLVFELKGKLLELMELIGKLVLRPGEVDRCIVWRGSICRYPRWLPVFALDVVCGQNGGYARVRACIRPVSERVHL